MRNKPLPKVPDTREIRSQLGLLYDAMNNPSEDLCVVFSTAYLDKLLGAMLKYVLVEDEHNSSGTMLASGVLASFGARINMAYSLGLISPWTCKTLKQLADIRNKFAHSIGHVTFRDPKVKQVCDDIEPPPIVNVFVNMGPEETTPLRSPTRNKFETIVSTVAFMLLRDSNTSFLNQFRCEIKAEDWHYPAMLPKEDQTSAPEA
jgi:hypothetical protein